MGLHGRCRTLCGNLGRPFLTLGRLLSPVQLPLRSLGGRTGPGLILVFFGRLASNHRLGDVH